MKKETFKETGAKMVCFWTKAKLMGCVKSQLRMQKKAFFYFISCKFIPVDLQNKNIELENMSSFK